MYKRKVTLRDLAEQLELNESTVSRALNGDIRIKRSTLILIALKAGEIGYKHKQYKNNSSKLNRSNRNVSKKVKDKIATIYDIAEELSISAATVSRALNDLPDVSSTTRKKVLKTAKNLNYFANKDAKVLTRSVFHERTSLKDKVTIYTIAQKLQISSSTVSRSFKVNSSTSSKTRALVIKTAQELGFIPNINAQRLRQKSY